MFCDADDMFYNMCGLWIIFREIDTGVFDSLTSIFVEETRNPLNNQPEYFNREMDSTFVHGKIHRRRYLIEKGIRWSVTIRQAVAKFIPSTGLAYTFVTGNSPTNTIKVKLNSETSLGTIGTTEGLYPVGVDSNGQLCVLISNE